MKSKLGIYVISLASVDILDYVRHAMPRVILSMDHSPEKWQQVKSISPNTFIIGRYYLDDSEQSYLDNPELHAQAFFDRMLPTANQMRGIYDAWMGYNEPVIHSDDEARKLSRFYVRWGDLMRQNGLTSAAYSFSTGNPAAGFPKPDGNGTEPNYWPLLADGLRHCDLLSLHEYSAPSMPNMEPYLCLRYRQAVASLPADAQRPVVITECGIDGGVLGPATAQQGWKKFTNEEGYLTNSLEWYDNNMQEDSYVIGATIFAASPWPDYGPNAGSFDISHADKIRDYIGQGGAPPPVALQTTLEGAVLATAKSVPWMPVNNGAALWKFAKAHGLQDQQSDELPFKYNGEDYITQVFNLGTVYVKVGDWNNIKVIPK